MCVYVCVCVCVSVCKQQEARKTDTAGWQAGVMFMGGQKVFVDIRLTWKTGRIPTALGEAAGKDPDVHALAWWLILSDVL